MQSSEGCGHGDLCVHRSTGGTWSINHICCSFKGRDALPVILPRRLRDVWTSLVTLALSVGLLILLVSDHPHLTVNLLSSMVSLCNLSMDFTKRFHAFTSDPSLAYFVPQKDICILGCAHGFVLSPE